MGKDYADILERADVNAIMDMSDEEAERLFNATAAIYRWSMMKISVYQTQSMGSMFNAMAGMTHALTGGQEEEDEE
jgi:hypothetical protein